METYLIIGASFSFIIGICKILRFGMLIRLWQHKKLHPNASLKDIENFEKSIKSNYNICSKIGGKNE